MNSASLLISSMLHPTDVGQTDGPKVTALLVPVLLYHLEQTVINVNKSDTFYPEFRDGVEYSEQNTYRLLKWP